MSVCVYIFPVGKHKRFVFVLNISVLVLHKASGAAQDRCLLSLSLVKKVVLHKIRDAVLTPSIYCSSSLGEYHAALDQICGTRYFLRFGRKLCYTRTVLRHRIFSSEKLSRPGMMHKIRGAALKVFMGQRGTALDQTCSTTLI